MKNNRNNKEREKLITKINNEKNKNHCLFGNHNLHKDELIKENKQKSAKSVH